MGRLQLQFSYKDKDKMCETTMGNNKRLLIVAGLVTVLVILSVFFCGYALFTKSAGNEMLLKKIGESQNLTTTEITELQDIINNLVIRNEADLSDEERQKLLDIINNMDNSTASSITSIKKYFMEQLGDTNENITNIVNGMEIDLTDIRNAIANNKEAIDKMETMLGECSIEYHSDGFYAVYHKGEADEVSKKLDFAQ